jgi:purine-binding chemotaxis protein CheW
MPKQTDDSSRIIIIEVEGHVMGMLVDSVAEVVYLNQSQIDTAPNVNDDSSKFIQGVSNTGKQLLILIDVDKLLADTPLADFTDF